MAQASDPVSKRSAAKGPEAWRLAAGLLGPPLLLSFALGSVWSAGHPPLDAVTGLGRWSVSGPAALLGMLLGLWWLAGPSSALVYGLSRALGRGGWTAIALATALPGLGWSLRDVWRRTGGPGEPLFLEELAFWSVVWLLACGSCAVWLHLSLTLGAPGADRRGAPDDPTWPSRGDV
ncbi:MAG: hypothetical protein AAF763_12375 [Pseudomonadota bacterium]